MVERSPAARRRDGRRRRLEQDDAGGGAVPHRLPAARHLRGQHRAHARGRHRAPAPAHRPRRPDDDRQRGGEPAPATASTSSTATAPSAPIARSSSSRRTASRPARSPPTAIIIATGSRPFHPPGVPFDDADVLDSDAAAPLDHPLQSLVVVGGGAVGCEFASIFTALGAEVTLVDSGPRLLPVHGRRDRRAAGRRPSAASACAWCRTPATPRRPAPPTGVRVELASGEALEPGEGDLRHRAAWGTPRGSGSTRRAWPPTTAAGSSSTTTTARRVEGIYAAGDVIGPPALASVSMEQARIAALLGLRPPAPAHRRLRCRPTACTPCPRSRWWASPRRRRSPQGIDHAVGRAPFAGQHPGRHLGRGRGHGQARVRARHPAAARRARARRRGHRAGAPRAGGHPLRRDDRVLHQLDVQRARP